MADDGKHAHSVIGVDPRSLATKWEGVQGEGGAGPYGALGDLRGHGSSLDPTGLVGSASGPSR